jgi:threonine dehydrogenase-like Zn-dependent dehydrogenase
MRGVWLEDGATRVRSDLPEPQAGEGEAVVAVTLAGICGTDLALLRESRLGGPSAFVGIPGHEFVGVVEEGSPEWLGRRVVSEINITCASRGGSRTCAACSAGRSSHCHSRSAIGICGRDGAFADRVALPVSNLHEIPPEIPDEDASFVEPLAAAFRVLEQVEIDESVQVLVVGPGRLGQLVARAVATTGSAPTVAGRSAKSLERARDAGMHATSSEDVEPGLFDVAVDCTGQRDGFALARAALRPGGTLVIKSTYADELVVDARSLMVDEIRVVGSRCGPFPAAIQALRNGSVRVRDLIDATYPLSEAPEAFAEAARPGVAKVLLRP